jgi:hypothetical protein
MPKSSNFTSRTRSTWDTNVAVVSSILVASLLFACNSDPPPRESVAPVTLDAPDAPVDAITVGTPDSRADGGCVKPEPLPRLSAACVEPLTDGWPASTNVCPARWSHPRAAHCKYEAGPYSVFKYRGPSGGYLVESLVTLLGGHTCVYDPGSEALVSIYLEADYRAFCCSAYTAIWSGPPLTQAVPTRELCDRALQAQTSADGGVDAATDAHD